MADLSVTNTVDKATASPGDLLTYTTKITNNSQTASNASALTNDIAPPLQNAQYLIEGDTTWRPWPGHINIDPIPGNGSRTVTIRGTVPPSAADGSTVTSKAVIADSSDTVTDNNEASATTTISAPIQTPSTDLAITNTVDRTTASPGDMLTYTTTVTNNGPNAAQSVVMSNPVSLTDLQYSLDGGQTFQTWTGQLALGTLANGASRTVILRGTVPSNAQNGTRVESVAAVTSSTPDLNPANNRASATTNIFITSAGCVQEREQYRNTTDAISTIAKEGNDAADSIKRETTYVDTAVARNSTPAELLDVNRSVSNRMDDIIRDTQARANRLTTATAIVSNPACPPAATAQTDRQNALNDVVNSIAAQENATAELVGREAAKNQKVASDPNATVNDVRAIGDSVADLLSKTATNNAALSNTMNTAVNSRP